MNRTEAPRTTSFEDLPEGDLVRAFGVEYGHISPSMGGDLYVTPFGWPYVEQLLPENWYQDKMYSREGERLPCSTSHVYHVLSRPVRGKRANLIVKFSRVGQDVPLIINTSFPDDVPHEIIAAARFNSPMEEFGLVMELRQSTCSTHRARILTQRPFAIYAPPEKMELWRLGRDESRFHSHIRRLAEDQEDEVKAIELDIKRQYVLLYGWINGKDAEQFMDEGLVAKEQLLQLSLRVIKDLEQRGFQVLDNKPRHFILRQRQSTGELVCRNGKELSYGLIDFELLQRTPEHQRRFKINQSVRFRRLLKATNTTEATMKSSHLKQVEILGINYFFSSTPDGGLLWVVGKNPQLFDYFVPDRWRRTRRIKMSPQNEVYRTCTRDNITVVYRRSSVGTRPRVDPLTDNGKRIRKNGYNSPFEEIMIAQNLRRLGISTTYPLAIYRTGHPATKKAYLHDPRRFGELSQVTIPGDENMAILDPVYDYYTIWDNFRGFDVTPDRGDKYAIDIYQAEAQCLISAKEKEGIFDRVEKLLTAYNYEDELLSKLELSISVTSRGMVMRDKFNEIDGVICVDALTALELDFINETEYSSIFNRLEQKLRAADCEKLDLKGSHLLLTMNLNCEFLKDSDDDIAVSLCNFEFISGLYRPLR